MNIETIDQYCDTYEERLKRGEKLSPEQFVGEIDALDDEQLIEELERVAGEYLEHRMPDAHKNGSPDAYCETVLTDLPASHSMIGRYKILKKIGEGGMGVVYMAEQTTPVSRRVALKVIRPGMDKKEVLARFEAERQALALMDHPNIARVLDAGTTHSDQPFFVMELVKGIPITEYCDKKQLTIKARLELFLKIAYAVQHAHQKGVIHRDLKPSNILVSEFDTEAVPKIIDFGVAKAIGQQLTPKTILTQCGQLVGTLEYMSPEQARTDELDIDTRSDIFSLGVILYELLIGTTPIGRDRIQSMPLDEMVRSIRDEDPPRPSQRMSSLQELQQVAAQRAVTPKQLTAAIDAELDWIVLKALEKERNRRYQSCGELVDDIDRFLHNQPVSACPPSFSYLCKKFVIRNKALVAGSLSVLATLILGLGLTTWFMIRANVAEINASSADERTSTLAKNSTRNVKTVRHLIEVVSTFQQDTSAILNRISTVIEKQPQLDNSELKELRRDIIDAQIDFWDKVIESSQDEQGKDIDRTKYYRLQRALLKSRLGEHHEAFDFVVSFAGPDSELSGRDIPRERLVVLARICAICARDTSDDKLAADCLERGSQFLFQAIQLDKQAIQSIEEERSRGIKTGQIAPIRSQIDALVSDPELEILRTRAAFQDVDNLLEEIPQS